MPAKAVIRSSYRLRLGIIAIALLAVGGWFTYDGAAGYPNENIKRNRYLEIKEEFGAEAPPVWRQEAEEQGWPIEIPKEPFSDWDIFAQFCYAVPSVVFGAWFAIGYLRSGGRWIESNEQGLATSSGQQISWDQIESMDKSRWETKGIAVVNYSHNGKASRITLDDWKFDRESTTAVVNEVEAHLTGSDQSPETQAGS